MNTKPDGKAKGSLICGIIGLFVAGIILGIVALVMANNSIKQNGPTGMAKAGRILGVIDIVAFFIVFIARLAASF